MRRLRMQPSVALVGLGLYLVVLANIGLTVHTGYHSLGAPHTGTSTQVLVGHSEPDASLHFEDVIELRTLTCPACVLQQQVGGSYFAGPENGIRTVVAGSPLAPSRGCVSAPFLSTRTGRGPPSS